MSQLFLNEARRVEGFWGQKNEQGLSLLDNISSSYERAVTAVLLENQKLANEKFLGESATDSADIATFKRISIPLVRRIFPNLIANKIISVQPLLGPTGLVYYLRFRYGSNKGAMRGADLSAQGYPYDDAASLQHKTSGDTNIDRFYTHQFVENETSSTDAGGDVTSIYEPLEHTPVLPGTLTGTIYDGAVAIQTFTVAESGTFTFTDIGSPSPKVTSGTLDETTGEVRLTWGAAPGANHVVFSYDYNMEGNADIPEVNMVVDSEQVTAVSRKLKAVWTFEAQQDIRSQHSLDLESEISGVMAQQVNLEIDREILGDIKRNAGTVSVWDFNTALGHNIKEKYESLYVKVVEMSAAIHRKTLRGDANWIVTSPEVAAIFETATAGFAPAPTDTFTGSLGVQYVATINQKWRLYKDPNFERNQLIMGYKGESYMDSGMFFCPYVPLTQTPTMVHPDDMTPRKGLMTRYGKKMLRDGARFFGRMSIANYVI